MSSRIFIKGLPPSISPDEFRSHFGKNFVVTDAKLIPQRRIGYIGYKDHEDAAKAVKYFNKSFIRMSRINVEHARPISDPRLPPSRKKLRELEQEHASSRALQKSSSAEPTSNFPAKRKRSDLDEADPKLKEYLELMQPPSKVKVQDSFLDKESQVEVNAKDEEPLPSASEHNNILSTGATFPLISVSSDKPLPLKSSENTANNGTSTLAATSDEEWLRSRKNRLLDLAEPEEVVPSAVQSISPKPDTHENPTNLSRASNTVDTIHGDASNDEILDDKSKSFSLIKSIKTTKRLFIRNLPYTASEDDLRQLFSQYGPVEEVHLPIDAECESKGFAFVQFADPAVAAKAFHCLDGESFQGRLLHILPGCAKREKKLNDFAISKLPLAKQRKLTLKSNAASMTFNWNSLYMDPDAINSAIASRLGVSKLDMLDPTSTDSGWKQALAETSVIQETKSYFVKHGVDLDSFKNRERGGTAILVKNFPYGTTIEELRRMFEEYGNVLQVLMPPTATIAIVEYSQPANVEVAFKRLAYRRIKDSIIFLEKAPKDLFNSLNTNLISIPEIKTESMPNQNYSASDLLEPSPPPDYSETSTLFVRNLNFSTTNERLVEMFRSLSGFLSARVNTKTDPKKPGQVLSMGFGFLEFKTQSTAQAALQAMDGQELDGHKLVIKASHRGIDAAEKCRRQDKLKKESSKRTKIIIKNLPFEASKNDIRCLFGAYGKLRSVRMPKKFDQTARGFAFADFVNAREAENAIEALKNTHLLGRRLVLEFAAGELLDAEEEIEKMQKKVSSQINKVAVRELTGKNRKKINIGNEDEEV